MPTFRKASMLALLGAVSLATLAGCGGGGGGGGSTVAPPPPPQSVHVVESNGLTATLSENANAVPSGSVVTYTLTLANTTGAPITIGAGVSSPTQPTAVLTVLDPSGKPLFGSTPPPPPLGSAILAPGQTLTMTFTTPAFSSPGAYTASARFSDVSPGVTVGPLPLTVQ